MTGIRDLFELDREPGRDDDRALARTERSARADRRPVAPVRALPVGRGRCERTWASHDADHALARAKPGGKLVVGVWRRVETVELVELDVNLVVGEPHQDVTKRSRNAVR